ncbi:hypothetical protein [Candidatus Enterococcus lemimoniae]|uniref:LXG domain-containing protein n=1 Tax=Candidatus Enterococcus lemimoniae TaxID=1834167 RepID=A0ABZ2T714_9ENTE|nr:hypothetical protein [Enterococcus sp. 12C11_DIV0727]OTO70912.1 hypothetical protein A5866_003162 [Enterococcus sp. 12C11_DIV0727]OTO70941.1 hypothetical protein A5866_003191 [Enterococcus sp. 12C11_DIV0727]
MAVKITQINDLSELQTKISQYSTSMSDAANAAQTTFSSKLDGSEAESVNQFVGVMNQLKSDAFAQLPQATTNFAQALQNYHSALTGAGFNNLIKSVKPTVEDEYCQKVTSTEYQKFEEKANGIKTVINEIAGVLPEVSDSKIETHLTSLQTELQNKTNEIKTTRSTVQEAQTAFKAALEAVTAELTQCVSSIENTMNITDPKSGLKPANMIKLISQGFGNAIVSGKMNKKDVEALNYLGEGEYDKLFKLDPNQLSDQLHGVLTNKVIDQVTLGEDAPPDLEKFLSALLSQTGEGAQARVAKYLEKFSEQTALQFAQLSAILMLDNSDPDLLSRYDKVRAVDTLFESLYVLNPVKRSMEDWGFGSQWVNYYSKLEGLHFGTDGDVSFDLKNYKSLSGYEEYGLKNGVKEIDSIRYDDAFEFSKAQDNQRLAELRVKKAQFVNEVLLTSASVFLGIFAPEVAGVIGIVSAIANAAGTVSGGLNQTKSMNELFDKGIINYQKQRFGDDEKGFKAWEKNYENNKKTRIRGGAGDIMGGIADLWSNWDQMAKDIDAQEMKILHNILDIGGLEISENDTITHTILTPVDKMTFEQQLRLIDFTENGYQSFFDQLDTSAEQDILNALKNKGKKNEDILPVIDFIKNGGDLSKVNIDQIQNVLRDAIKNTNLNNKEQLAKDASRWFMDPKNK